MSVDVYLFFRIAKFLIFVNSLKNYLVGSNEFFKYYLRVPETAEYS